MVVICSPLGPGLPITGAGLLDIDCLGPVAPHFLMKGPVHMSDDHKYITLTFNTTDGTEHSVNLKKREYRTRRQMKDINNWVKKHAGSDGHDLLIYIVSMEDKNVAKILEDGDVELAEYDRMLNEFSEASDADEVNNPEGESSASSAS